MNDTGFARENSHPVIPNPEGDEESFTGARERFLTAFGMTG